jgi:hypothetical protein
MTHAEVHRHGVNVQSFVIQFHRLFVYANVNRFAVNV